MARQLSAQKRKAASEETTHPKNRYIGHPFIQRLWRIAAPVLLAATTANCAHFRKSAPPPSLSLEDRILEINSGAYDDPDKLIADVEKKLSKRGARQTEVNAITTTLRQMKTRASENSVLNNDQALHNLSGYAVKSVLDPADPSYRCVALSSGKPLSALIEKNSIVPISPAFKLRLDIADRGQFIRLHEYGHCLKGFMRPSWETDLMYNRRIEAISDTYWGLIRIKNDEEDMAEKLETMADTRDFLIVGFGDTGHNTGTSLRLLANDMRTKPGFGAAVKAQNRATLMRMASDYARQSIDLDYPILDTPLFSPADAETRDDGVVAYARSLFQGVTLTAPRNLTGRSAGLLIRMSRAVDLASTFGPANNLSNALPRLRCENAQAFSRGDEILSDSGLPAQKAATWGDSRFRVSHIGGLCL